MAKKQGKTAWNGTQEKNSDVSYADVTLTAADKDAFSSWMSGVSQDFSTVLRTVLDESYRVSLKFDYYNSCYTCSLTQQDTKHRNSGLVISSRSDDPEEAFWLNIYKVYVLYEGQRLPDQAEARRWG